MPAWVSRRCIHPGDGRDGSTPRTTCATNRSQPGTPWIGASSSSSTANSPAAGARSAAVGTPGSVNGAPVEWEYSRATPRIEKQYPRSGVTLISSTSSARPSRTLASAPTCTAAGSMPYCAIAASSSTRMPSWSSPMPSSRTEQIIPSEMWP